MNRKRNVFAVVLLCLVLFLQGCTGGGGGGGNKPPKIDAYQPASKNVMAAIGEEVTFSVTASDPDGNTLSYSWSETGEGTLSAGNSNTAKWTAPQEAGTATVKVTVTDGKGGIVSHTWNIEVTTAQPPIIANPTPVTSQANPMVVHLNEERVLAITTSDPAGRTLTSQWIASAGTVKDAQLNTAKWTAPSVPGPAQVTVTVSNGEASRSHTWYFSVQGNVVPVTQNITEPTTWAAGNIYVINSVDIEVTSTLTIQPGTIVKLGENRRLSTEGSGRINAVGTASEPIIFTSLKDDLRGGDTNADQNSSWPDAGDWDEILLYSKSGNVFEYCEFYYGGGGPREAMLDLYESRGTVVKNCTFAFSEGAGLSALYVPEALITSNTFYNNKRPLVINVNVAMDKSNTFHNPQNPSEKNTFQGIFVDSEGGYTFTKNIYWIEDEVAFVLTGWDFEIDSGAKLTISPGVTVKLDNNRLYVYGELDARAATQAWIAFTSLKDSRYGGQSNGPTSSQPEAGDWGYIEIAIGGKATFEFCRFAYGGEQSHRYDGSAALFDGEQSRGTEVSYCYFEHNLRGLDLLSSRSSIQHTNFHHNDYPLRVGFDVSTDNTLTIRDNKYNAIYLGGSVSGFSKPQRAWKNTAVPYVLNETIDLDDGMVVELGTGTIIRVWQDESINVYSGTLQNWTNAIFTSYRDNAWGGDVGGGSIGPQIGDWEGIWDGNIGDYLSGPNIHYAERP